MTARIQPQFILDSEGKKSFVVLPIAAFEQLLEEIEMNEDIRLYDEAKKNDNGEWISMEDAFSQIEKHHKLTNDAAI